MDLHHWILLVLWILYVVIHSLLAAVRVKLFFENISGQLFRYYRLAYSILSTVALLFIIYFQYSFTSPVLTNARVLKYISVLMLVPGLTIMVISIIKYFKLLSGIRSLYYSKSTPELKLTGIHKFVRHPLYLGTLLFIWGLFFIFPWLNNFIAAVIISVYILIGIRLEEKKLLAEFGHVYANYISQVPMLIPGSRRVKHNKKGQPSGRP